MTPLKDAAMMTKTDVGYRYQAGQQGSRLEVSVTAGRLSFVDLGTATLKSFPASCRKEQAKVGIALSCRVPARYGEATPMFVEVWPRLGDDVIDGSTLSAAFRLWTLADAGNDRVFGGAGDDFVNGAQDDDLVRGGAGDDWIRSGIGNDDVWADQGTDKIVAGDGADVVHGGGGNDQVGGGNGSDQLWGDTGKDRVSCGAGADDAWLDFTDRALDCESVERS